MSNMKKATIREVQHNLSGILRWVEEGEEVQVMRRKRIVAVVVPAGRPTKMTRLPDFEKRAAGIFGSKPAGPTASRILIDNREERF
jgi:antitoxin (DNA-binding transcriptional repressor) of toxin-antitoxin stability system